MSKLPPLIIGPGVKPPPSADDKPEPAPRIALSEPLKKYMSAHCLVNEAHENERKLSPKGSLYASCRGVYEYRFGTIRCNCWCHEIWDAIRPQVEAVNASISAVLSFPDPSMGAIPTQSAGTRDVGTVAGGPDGSIVAYEAKELTSYWDAVVRDPMLDINLRRQICANILKTDIPPLEAESAETRRARGSLDVNVETVIRMSLEGHNPFPLTTEGIALMINPADKVSQGAIHAVLMRWESAGFVILGRKPLCFQSFTDKVGPGGITQAKKVRKREKIAHQKGFFV